MTPGCARAAPDFLGHGDFVYRDGFTPVIRRAFGVTLEDDEGRLFLDMEASNGSASLGYTPSLLAKAAQQMAALPSCPVFLESDVRLRLAEKLQAFVSEATGVPGRVAFELGGAQGIELAMKIARANTRGSQMIVFEGGYHGRSGWTSQLSASHRYRAITGDWRIPVVRLPLPDCDQCRFSKTPSTCSRECATFAETLLTREACGASAGGNGRDFAAFVFEPVLNTAGMALPDREYLARAAAAVRAGGGLLIADETFTGFHRTGPRFGFQHHGVVPDIIVLGKALTNGIVPLACVWAREDLLAPERFPPGTHSATFIHSMLSMTIAEAVLERYRQWPDTEGDVLRLERALTKVTATISARHPEVVATTAIGAAARLLLSSDNGPAVVARARSIGLAAPIHGYHGLILATSAMAPNVVSICPSLFATDDDVTAMGELLDRALNEGRG